MLFIVTATAMVTTAAISVANCCCYQCYCCYSCCNGSQQEVTQTRVYHGHNKTTPINMTVWICLVHIAKYCKCSFEVMIALRIEFFPSQVLPSHQLAA